MPMFLRQRATSMASLIISMAIGTRWKKKEWLGLHCRVCHCMPPYTNIRPRRSRFCSHVARMSMPGRVSAIRITPFRTITQMLVEAGGHTTACDDEHGTPPLIWARFFIENLEQGSAEFKKFIDYLTPMPH